MSSGIKLLTTEELLEQIAGIQAGKVQASLEQIRDLGDELDRRGLKGIPAGKLMQIIHRARDGQEIPFEEEEP